MSATGCIEQVTGALVGERPVELAESFVRHYGRHRGSQWLHKERRRLANAVYRASKAG
ncbi:hypothetical protein [Rathayibacter soli]|uniref:hypothetical protein n=1 Tax=Rathayibacter soli TaxID=3144168 RepID=UPI0027E49666|nr:hypothetical protein [Glaciibacter superstes]